MYYKQQSAENHAETGQILLELEPRAVEQKLFVAMQKLKNLTEGTHHCDMYLHFKQGAHQATAQGPQLCATHGVGYV